MQIRPIHTDDAPVFFNLIEKNREYLQNYFPQTLVAVRDPASSLEFIEEKNRQFERREMCLFVVVLETKLVGMLSLKTIDWSVPKAELAYFIDRDFQGRGIVTQGVSWLTAYGFDELGLEKVYARVSPSNMASKRILEKNAFSLEGFFRADFRSGRGELMDSEYYGLLKAEANPVLVI